jgi:hypothetical protein
MPTAPPSITHPIISQLLHREISVLRAEILTLQLETSARSEVVLASLNAQIEQVQRLKQLTHENAIRIAEIEEKEREKVELQAKKGMLEMEKTELMGRKERLEVEEAEREELGMEKEELGDEREGLSGC